MSNQKRFALIGRSFGSDAFDEYVQDLIGALLADSSEIDFTYTDATPTLTASLINGSVVFARLQNFDALSVLGRSANSAGVGDEIAAGANDRLLRRTSDTLNFGQLTAGMFPNTVVPDAALSSNVPLKDAANTFTGTRQTFSNTNPLLVFVDTDAAANNQKWGLYSNSGAFGLFAWNDAESALGLALNIVRSGATITSIAYGNTTDLPVHDFYGALRSNDEMQIEGGVNSTLSIDKNGALGTKRFGLFVGDGTGGTTADENYIRSLNTTLNFWGGALGTTLVASFSSSAIALAATAITVNGLDLASGAAVSLLGRSANSAGARADITASANDRLLRRTGDTLNFGQLTSGMFPNTVVPDAALSANVPLLDAFNTFTGVFLVSQAAPSWALNETDAATNEKAWSLRAVAGDLRWTAWTDGFGSDVDFLTVTRTGTTIDAITFTSASMSLASDVTVTDALRVRAAQVRLNLEETGATANEGYWQFRADGDELHLYTLSDAFSASGDVMKVTRTGTTIDEIELNAALLDFNGAVVLDSPIRLRGYTVATLPAGAQGDTAYVTDALAPAFLTAIVGGGAVVTPVFYDGTNWVAI